MSAAGEWFELVSVDLRKAARISLDNYQVKQFADRYVVFSKDGENVVEVYPKRNWIECSNPYERIRKASDDRFDAYLRKENRKHLIVEVAAWTLLVIGNALLVWNFFGGK